MFTENQVRQLYVVNAIGAEVTNSSVDGAIKLAATGTDTIDATVREFYFIYKGPSDDGVQRTDLIDKCNIIDIRATAAEDLQHKMKKLFVTLSDDVNDATPIVGQNYILNVDIHSYIAPDYNSLKGKFGATKATSTTASDLYKALAVSLAKNMSREPVELVKIYLATAEDGSTLSDEVTGKNTSDLTDTYYGIVIEEAEQPWRRGVAPQEFVNFKANPSTIYVETLDDDYVWGTVTDLTEDNENVIPNSKAVADMEWFFHKERGDRYGESCWPNNIDTEYMVTSSNDNWEDGFSFLDIHYYTEGNSHNVGKSEKTLTLVGLKTTLNSLLTLITTVCSDTPVNIITSTSWSD